MTERKLSGDSDSHRRQSVTVFCHIERVFGIYGGCEYVKDSFKNRQRLLYI